VGADFFFRFFLFFGVVADGSLNLGLTRAVFLLFVRFHCLHAGGLSGGLCVCMPSLIFRGFWGGGGGVSGPLFRRGDFPGLHCDIHFWDPFYTQLCRELFVDLPRGPYGFGGRPAFFVDASRTAPGWIFFLIARLTICRLYVFDYSCASEHPPGRSRPSLTSFYWSGSLNGEFWLGDFSFFIFPERLYVQVYFFYSAAIEPGPTFCICCLDEYAFLFFWCFVALVAGSYFPFYSSGSAGRFILLLATLGTSTARRERHRWAVCLLDVHKGRLFRLFFFFFGWIGLRCRISSLLFFRSAESLMNTARP